MSYTDNYFLGKTIGDTLGSIQGGSYKKLQHLVNVWNNYQNNLNIALSYRNRTNREAFQRGIIPNVSEIKLAKKIRDKIYAENGNPQIAQEKWKKRYIKRFANLLIEDRVILNEAISYFRREEEKPENTLLKELFSDIPNHRIAEMLETGEMELLLNDATGDGLYDTFIMWADNNRKEAQAKQYKEAYDHLAQNCVGYYYISQRWFSEWEKLDFIPKIDLGEVKPDTKEYNKYVKKYHRRIKMVNVFVSVIFGCAYGILSLFFLLALEEFHFIGKEFYQTLSFPTWLSFFIISYFFFRRRIFREQKLSTLLL